MPFSSLQKIDSGWNWLVQTVEASQHRSISWQRSCAVAMSFFFFFVVVVVVVVVVAVVVVVGGGGGENYAPALQQVEREKLKTLWSSVLQVEPSLCCRASQQVGCCVSVSTWALSVLQIELPTFSLRGLWFGDEVLPLTWDVYRFPPVKNGTNYILQLYWRPFWRIHSVMKLNLICQANDVSQKKCTCRMYKYTHPLLVWRPKNQSQVLSLKIILNG